MIDAESARMWLHPNARFVSYDPQRDFELEIRADLILERQFARALLDYQDSEDS